MDDERELTELRNRVRSLEYRLEQTEAATSRIVFAFATLTLIAGLVLPYIEFKFNGDEHSTAIGWMALQGAIESDQPMGGEGTVIFIIFSLPVIVSVIALVLLWNHAADRDAKRRRGLDITIGTLLVLSIFGLLIVGFAALGAQGTRTSLGPALLLYIPGAISVAVLLINSRVREWWSAR